MTKNKLKKSLLYLTLFGFILLNIIAYNHAHKFTHFEKNSATHNGTRIKPEDLSLLEKVKTLFFGIQNFKPKNTTYPTDTYETITLNSNEKLEGWLIKPDTTTKGTVILFHGYTGNKSELLTYGKEFMEKGYAIFLIDFMGSGNSEGYETTIGYKESENVKTAFEYLKSQGEEGEIILFGHSMGAVAIMKSINDYHIKPNKIIIHCPFGSMKTTVKQRFKAMGVPSFPFAELLVFYGGLQNGFNAFQHNPTKYAQEITIPSLLVYGEQDKRVTRNEIDEIYQNLQGNKELLVLKQSGHENYLIESYEEWTVKVNEFLKK